MANEDGEKRRWWEGICGKGEWRKMRVRGKMWQKRSETNGGGGGDDVAKEDGEKQKQEDQQQLQLQQAATTAT